jgi:hypothetical protein
VLGRFTGGFRSGRPPSAGTNMKVDSDLFDNGYAHRF